MTQFRAEQNAERERSRAVHATVRAAAKAFHANEDREFANAVIRLRGHGRQSHWEVVHRIATEAGVEVAEIEEHIGECEADGLF